MKQNMLLVSFRATAALPAPACGWLQACAVRPADITHARELDVSIVPAGD